MAEASLAQPAQLSTPLEEAAEKAEREIARLRRARPELGNRIDRAEHLLVTQLSCSNGSRPIRVCVKGDGSHEYHVTSASKLRRVYVVDPDGFRCSCPWQASGGTGCYHSIACYILSRVYLSGRPRPTTGSEKPCESRRTPLWGAADPDRLAALAARLGV